MIIKNFHLVFIFFLTFCISFQTIAQEERRHVRKGIELLENEEYTKAEAAFREALRHNPSSFEAGYNLASTLFRLERFEDAIEQLQAIAPFTKEDEMLAKLYHNLGNSYLFNQDIENSIEAYKESLRKNPLDNETRYNLIAAMKLRDQQEEEEEEEEEQQEEQQEQEQQQQEEQEQEEQQQDQSEGISREAAERLLQAVEEDEKEIMEKMDRHQEDQPVRIEKNW